MVYHVVEPNPSTNSRKIVEERNEYERVQFKWYTGYFEQFCDEIKTRTSEADRFDLLHFVRAFYHIDSEKAFDYVYQNLLVRNGIMCAIGENGDSFWPKMMYSLADRQIEHKGFMGSGPVSKNYFLPGWLEQTRERKWTYESYVHGYLFDITPMYDPTSKDGNYLIDFVMHSKDARRNIKRSVVNDFFKFLEDNKIEREIVKNGVRGKKMYFPCEFGAIMITKQ